MVTEAEARRLRPFMSGIVALAVALVAAIGWYYLGRPDDTGEGDGAGQNLKLTLRGGETE